MSKGRAGYIAGCVLLGAAIVALLVATWMPAIVAARQRSADVDPVGPSTSQPAGSTPSAGS